MGVVNIAMPTKRLRACHLHLKGATPHCQAGAAHARQRTLFIQSTGSILAVQSSDVSVLGCLKMELQLHVCVQSVFTNVHPRPSTLVAYATQSSSFQAIKGSSPIKHSGSVTLWR